MSNDEFEWNPRRGHCKNDHYKDTYSRYQPLNGTSSDQPDNEDSTQKI